jgi:molybdenum cofactor guanylyltransferase
MTGVVLCGGQSSRMGSDKGLLLHQSATWTQLAVDKLRHLQLPVVLSVNAQQYVAYSNLFQNLILVTDDSNLNVGGPLKGLLSVHLSKPDDDLMVLACDMRDMQPEVLEHLMTIHSENQKEAVVFRNGDMIEPLCSIYTAKGLCKVNEQYRHGFLKKFSMHAILQYLDTLYIPVPEAWQNCFRNFNTAADLRML